MTEFEIFRISPKVGEKCYEYAESTRKQGRYPNERYFTKTQPLYVGRLIRTERGGFGDGGWQTDYFQDNEKEHFVNYSYEGNTCFREVPCRPAVIPSLETLSRNVVKQGIDYSALPEDDPRRKVIEQQSFGGKNRRHKRSKKRTWSRKYKKSINCRRPKGFSQKQYCKYGRKTRKNM